MTLHAHGLTRGTRRRPAETEAVAVQVDREGTASAGERRPAARPAPHVARAVADRVIGVLLILATIPVLVAASLAILLCDGPPILFSQTRIGRDGRPFTMWKLRTMERSAEAMRPWLSACNEQGGHLFKVRRDPRVTPLGRRLRRFSIDELPQLWNVVRGEMALVGPRPLLPEEAADFPGDGGWRLQVRPAVTGLWQVSGRADLPWSEAVRLDRLYVESQSLSLDVVVLVRTIGAVLSGRGAY